MFNRNDIIVGLEIGTSKVCVVVGELDDTGALNVVGLGKAPSRGSVRKGEIVNTEIAEDAIREAMAAAEEHADIEIGSVYLGLTGAHFRGFNHKGVHPIASIDREIDEEDMAKVVANAQPQMPAGEEVLHTIRQHFQVDGQEGVDDPVGRFASQLEVNVHVICGQVNRIQHPVRVVKGLGIEVADVAFNGRVDAMATVTPQHGEQGVVMINLGAGTTEYVVYLNGSLRHSGVLAIGGDHVTNDIAVGLKVSQSRAERLKLEHGSALPDLRRAGRTVNYSSEVGLDDRAVSVGHLHQIMHARLEELLQLIRNDLEQARLLKSINSGVRLTGGGVWIPQIEILAREVFETDIVTADLTGNGPQNILEGPEYSTAIGLVKYGAQQTIQNRRRRGGLFGWLAGK